MFGDQPLPRPVEALEVGRTPVARLGVASVVEHRARLDLGQDMAELVLEAPEVAVGARGGRPASCLGSGVAIAISRGFPDGRLSYLGSRIQGLQVTLATSASVGT
jgi:hypothetical protein